MHKSFGYLLGLVMLLLGAAPAEAVYLHQFYCNNCHVVGISLYDSGNGGLCVQCHRNGGIQITTDDGRTGPESYFDQNDLSNAMGTAGFSPTEQTSHNWAAMRDNLPAAGATPADSTLYYSNYGASYNKVTCSKCHNPHATYSGTSGTGQNLALRLDNSDDGVCLNCHTLFHSAPADALGTHPVGITLAGDSVRASIIESEVVLINNGTDDVVSCSSCHGVHWTDSDGTTDDGVDQADPLDPAYTTGLNAGDGHLLVLDGLQTSGATTLETAQRHSILCQACHDYAIHGTADESPIGCLVCHSGHSYDPDFPNYFVLRKEVSTTPFGDASGLDYSSLPGVWDDGINSTADGYCEKCHGDVAGGAAFSDGRPTHASGEVCSDCHTHPGGFAGAGCDGCHGYPPPPAATGYALNENNLHHQAHAGGVPYSFTCTYCHNAGTDASTHNQGTFQDVYVGGFAIDDFVDRAGALTPSYTGGTYTCAAVYCHSNGAKRTGDGSVSYKTASITWTVGQTVNCFSCHGNDETTMLAADRDNSAAHIAHLGGGDYSKTYSCKFCHVDTAINSTALATDAEGTFHVNGSHDVGFDTTTDNLGNGTLSFDSGTYPTGFDLTTGACMVYCHSDGKGNYAATNPDWDVAASGDCGACHGVTSATLTSGAHAKHLDTARANVSCDSCHGANASSGTHSGHIDGAITTLTTAASCDTCHGVELLSGETWDVSPTWTTSTDPAVNHVDCRTCHHGSSTTSYTDASSVSRTAPAKTVFYTYGHGITGASKPAKNCFDCHEGSTNTYSALHMDGTAGDNRLLTQGGNAFETAQTAYCSDCHETTDVETVHYDTTGSSIAGNTCSVCHDPHGQGSLDAMIRTTIGSKTVTGFADRTLRSSYYTTTLVGGEYQGICQVCHVVADVKHFNQTTEESATHGGTGVCISCHVHTNTPAFKANCFDCHGGGSSGTTSGFKNYWPDDSTTDAENDAGEHATHVLEIAKRRGFTTLDALLNDAGADAEQIAICGYCHAAGPNDDDHGTAGVAEVFSATVGGSATQVAKALWGADDAATVASYDAAADTCSNVDCHNSKLTTDGTYGWYDSGTATCTLCHTRATSGSNPSSGLHYGSTAPTVSGQWHDDTLTGGCIVCHTDLPANDSTAASTHIDSFFTGDSSSATDRTNMGLFTAYTNGGSDNVGSCSGTLVGDTAGCHGNDGNGVTGNGDDGGWARVWDSSKHYLSDGTECAGCHGGANGTSWTFGGGAHDAADGSVEHAYNLWDALASADVIGRHSGNTDESDQCNICHVYPDSPFTVNPGSEIGWKGNTGNNSTYHGDGLIQMNGTMGYTDSGGDAYGCTDNCHTGGAVISMEDSGWDLSLISGPALSCSSCHTGFTTHIDADGSGGTTYPSASPCEDCHAAHTGYRSGVNAANDVYIPTIYNRTVVAAAPDTGTAVPTMNNQYASHDSYIQLGGVATDDAGSFSTEAEMCWGCHDAVGISEWGTDDGSNNNNQGLAGTAITYDYGDLYTDAGTVPGTKTSNWTTGYWRSGKGRASGSTSNPFWYKKGAVQSTHSVNFDSGVANFSGSPNALGYAGTRVENKDAVANIRCSYCHDVHGTHNTVNGDPAVAEPYLRGTWKGNPYPEDGAPQWGMANWTVDTPTANSYGRVPRGSASSSNSGLSGVTQAGGWWIDQNSGNPNSSETTASYAGLCEQCHATGGTVNGTWDTTEIGNIDQVTGEGFWTSGYNGHANVVVGGGGRGADGSTESYARNIFTRTRRGSDTATSGASENPTFYVDMGMATITGTDRGYSYRSNSSGYGLFWYPRTSTTSTSAAGTDASYAYRYFAWNAVDYNSTVTRGSSIAAGTATLQVSDTTSTIGTDHIEAANYDAQANYHTFTCSKCHNPHASRLPKLMITNCLDTNHNTWEDDSAYTGSVGAVIASASFSGSTLSCGSRECDDLTITGQLVISGSTSNDGVYTLSSQSRDTITITGTFTTESGTSGVSYGPITPWTQMRHSQWPSAQNCHRLDARAPLSSGADDSVGTGWNKVTPWQEYTNPNSTRTNPNP